MNNKKITVVICTYNRANLLKISLQSLVEQTLDQSNFDVLVIDNNSNDITKEVVNMFKSLLPLKYVFEPTQGLSHARNRAIKEVKSEYIAYIDDDSKGKKNWLMTASKIIDDKNPDIFGGPYYPYYINKKKWFLDKYEIREASKNDKFLDKYEFLSGSNIFFKKDIFEKIGIFDVNLGMKGNNIGLGEETQLQVIANKLGINRYYCSDLIIYNLVPDFKMDLKYVSRRYFMAGLVSNIVTGYKSTNFLKSLIIFIFYLIKTFSFLFFIFFRNKKKYKYWQNYFFEKILPYCGVVGN